MDFISVLLVWLTKTFSLFLGKILKNTCIHINKKNELLHTGFVFRFFIPFLVEYSFDHQSGDNIITIIEVF